MKKVHHFLLARLFPGGAVSAGIGAFMLVIVATLAYMSIAWSPALTPDWPQWIRWGLAICLVLEGLYLTAWVNEWIPRR